MFSNCARKITVRPEFASPQLFFHLGTAPEYFSCRQALYHRYDLRHAIRRNRLHQEMDMIPIRTNLQKFHLIALLDLQTHFLYNVIDMFIKHRTPILGRKYQMVYQYTYVMTLMYIFAHIGILRRKRRGIQPQAIEVVGWVDNGVENHHTTLKVSCNIPSWKKGQTKLRPVDCSHNTNVTN
jgi:hypothetical protein